MPLVLPYIWAKNAVLNGEMNGDAAGFAVHGGIPVSKTRRIFTLATSAQAKRGGP